MKDFGRLVCALERAPLPAFSLLMNNEYIFAVQTDFIDGRPVIYFVNSPQHRDGQYLAYRIIAGIEEVMVVDSIVNPSFVYSPIINIDKFPSAGNDSSMLLWRAYVSIEYAILILKLTYNNNNSKNEIQPQSKPKKSNFKDAIVTKTTMNLQDNNDVIRRLKFILQHLNFQDKKPLLRELRLHRNIIKNWLQKKEYQ